MHQQCSTWLAGWLAGRPANEPEAGRREARLSEMCAALLKQMLLASGGAVFSKTGDAPAAASRPASSTHIRTTNHKCAQLLGPNGPLSGRWLARM